jgi:hypothetical protein
MDSHLQQLAARQRDVVAAWQLRQVGWNWNRLRHHAHSRGWRRIHSGVYLLSQAVPTQIQLWWAAALSSPDSTLSHGSGGACFGFYDFRKEFEVVTRPGQGGRRRQGGLLVFRSKRLEGEVTRRMGIPITTPERVLVDIVPGLTEEKAGRCFREAIRLKTTTAARVLACVRRHGDAPAVLARLATRYASLPYGRTRSNPEALALELLHDAGIEPPEVNVRIAGEEADLVWASRRVIVEIDGPQYHRIRDEDARKERLWRQAGYTVRRAPSGLVYDAPVAFVALCRE